MTVGGARAQVSFYAEPGPMTVVGGIPAQLVEAMPSDPVGIAGVVQGLVLHPFWASSYGVSVPDERLAELQIRSAARMMNRIVALATSGRSSTAGAAWLACRAGKQDGDRFGIMDEWGQWFIKGNIVRDLASLNKVEMLPWDGWSDLEGPVTSPDDLPVLDDLARLTVSDNLGGIQCRYETDDRLSVKATVLRFFPELIEDTVEELA